MKKKIFYIIILSSLLNTYANWEWIGPIKINRARADFGTAIRIFTTTEGNADYEFEYDINNEGDRHKASLLLSVLLTAQTTGSPVSMYIENGKFKAVQIQEN